MRRQEEVLDRRDVPRRKRLGGLVRALRFVPVLLVAVVLAACSDTANQTPGTTGAGGQKGPSTQASSGATGIKKIDNVVIIAQENKSFDTYFGTFPGAEGIPMRNGKPTVCSKDPVNGKCETPYYNSKGTNLGGPHDAQAFTNSVNGGKMDGFLEMERAGRKVTCKGDGIEKYFDPECSPADKGAEPDVMGYRDARDIPNYWRYAEEFVLQDRFFAPVRSASVPNNVARLNGWAATCDTNDPASCKSDLNIPNVRPKGAEPEKFSQTDITYLLHKNNVSWRYYVEKELKQGNTPLERNPMPSFTTVKQNGQLGNIQDVENYYAAAKSGNLPAVSWVMSGPKNSEHPPASIQDGQAFVTRAINAVMQGPNWDTTAIFLTWDEWGGFYDHVPPVKVDQNGYGIRVPGLIISPYARKGYIDSQTLSPDAYLKFIEDRFLNGQRLDPATLDRPDPRPTVREEVPELGDITKAFDFSQNPRPPVVLPERPKPGPASTGG
ncbi:MAG: alkaline phosphatase family protein [Rubrobacteraceae bacterium]